MTPRLGSPAPAAAERQQQLDFFAMALWLVAATIAVFFAVLMKDSAVVDGMYFPRTNDSLYHARRILDAAVGPGFYEFDQRLHAPDGAWISWPWAYDYLMAKAAQVALWIDPTIDVLAFISYVPVAWVVVNAALFLAVATAIDLSREMRVFAMLCFAFSPLTQLLHSIAMIDHHYVEHTFVLLNVWLGVRWFQQPGDMRRAALLGVALGFAPAFHNGLFILQLIPLAAIFGVWVRGQTPSPKALGALAATLLIATQLVLLPSEPYRRGMFEFGLLSWFHFYIAVCTAAATTFMGWKPFSRGNFIGFAVLCIALAAPLGAQFVSGAGFITGTFSILDAIIEVRSPYDLFTETFGPMLTASHYSWLLLAAPPLLAFFAFRALREQAPDKLYYAVAASFGLFLLLQQFRLHYFGLFALVTGCALIIDQLRIRLRWHRGATLVGALALFAAAYQPALRERLFYVYSPGGVPEYASILALYFDLGTACAEDPGIVLASSDDGNAVLFHSDCSVIANNFILRPEDDRHIAEAMRLMTLSPAEILQQRPDVKYLLLRARDFVEAEGDIVQLSKSSELAQQLLTSATAPPRFKLLKTVQWLLNEKGDTAIFARLYKVLPADSVSAPQTLAE